VDRLRDTNRRFAETISSAAVEQVVVWRVRGSEAAVVGVPDEIAGQEVLVALIAEAGALIDEALLAERLQELLPKHATPRCVRVAATLPKTPSGKIRKARLGPVADGDWRRY
jgi:crotonobetaine/carnitine-CoA ligase